MRNHYLEKVGKLREGQSTTTVGITRHCPNISILIHEEAVQEFQRQHVMDLVGIVLIALQMALDHSFKCFPLDVWPRQRAWVHESLPNVASQSISVPDSVMIELVSAQNESFEM